MSNTRRTVHGVAMRGAPVASAHRLARRPDGRAALAGLHVDDAPPCGDAVRLPPHVVAALRNAVLDVLLDTGREDLLDASAVKALLSAGDVVPALPRRDAEALQRFCSAFSGCAPVLAAAARGLLVPPPPTGCAGR